MGDKDDLFDFFGMNECILEVTKELAQESIIVRKGKVWCLQQPQPGSLVRFSLEEKKARSIISSSRRCELSPPGGMLLEHSLMVTRKKKIYFMHSDLHAMVSTGEN